ncbi:MAG: autotransporter-associated beta strand repeat-containing protein, partial [Verrucomicrobiota bacterium]
MKIRFREWSARFLTFVCLLLVSVQPVFAAGPNDARPAFPPGLQLRDKLHGEAAIEAMRNELPAVAAFYRKTPEQLEKLLRQDNSLWVDRNGRLFYVCDLTAPATADTNVAPSVAEIAPLSQTFLLHSRPGSTKTIFLDFDGYTISGTQWNTAYNSGADIVAPPWDTDGNPASFSTSEQTAIQQIWLRVAEDYAPYDVDVTTEFPGEAAITRSSSSDQIYGTRALVSAISSYFGSYGGIAYVGVFDGTGNTYKPALIFPEKLGNSEKNIAEAISHEVGHNLGLSHDGIVNGADYYSGQGNWAPIMGVGYYEPITQWSKGEYANANNTEDDLTIITQNGLSYRTDDHGNSTATATALSGTSIVTSGVIERQTDLDFFSFPTGAGTAQFTVTPWERGADLHLLVSVYNSAGTLVTNREVADTSAGVQPVSINVSLSSGTYYLSVQGVGVGDPFTTGYSDYANLGQYTVSISLPGISSWIPVAGGAYSWTNLANWSAGVPSVVDANARLTNNLLGNQTISLDSPVTIGRLLIGDADGSHNFTIEDGSGGPLIFKTTVGNAAVLKSTGSADVIASGVNLQSPLVASNGSAANLTFSGPISGANGFVKSGSGLVTLSGTNTYSGDTTISNGVLAIAPEGSISTSAKLDLKSGGILDASATSGDFLVGSGQTVAGSGIFLGDAVLSSGSAIAPGSSTAAGTLTFSNNLIFPDGGTLEFDLAANNATGGGTNDLVVVAGQLSLAGTNFFSVRALEGQLMSPGTYTVLRYGTMSGGAANLVYANPTTRYEVIADDSVAGEIQLQVSGNALPLTWRGDGIGNTWNVAGSSKWFNGTAKDRFYQFDSVTFDDSGSNSPSINLTGTISPTAFIVNASKSYTFAGTGKISGATGLAKSGSGTLTLNNANDFTGAITVSGGILKPANAAALGNPSAITIQNGGTLDLNALSLGSEPLTVQGAGVGNSGALINSSGTAQINALQ